MAKVKVDEFYIDKRKVEAQEYIEKCYGEVHVYVLRSLGVKDEYQKKLDLLNLFYVLRETGIPSRIQFIPSKTSHIQNGNPVYQRSNDISEWHDGSTVLDMLLMHYKYVRDNPIYNRIKLDEPTLEEIERTKTVFNSHILDPKKIKFYAAALATCDIEQYDNETVLERLQIENMIKDHSQICKTFERFELDEMLKRFKKYIGPRKV